MVGITNLKGDISRAPGIDWDRYVKYAVIIGTPIALGVGYLVYRNYQNSRTQSTAAGKAVKAGNSGVKKETTPLDKAQSSKLRGNKYFKGQQYAKAIECYTEAVKHCPKEHGNDLGTFYQNRAAAHEQLKNYDEVISDCTQALLYNKKYVKALNRRAKACEQLGNLKQSLEDITAVCILEGFQNEQSLLTADRVLRALGMKNAKEAFQNRQPELPSNHFIRTYFSSFVQDPVMNNLNEPDVVPVSDVDVPEPVAEQTVEGAGEPLTTNDLSQPKNCSKDSPFILVKKALKRRIYDDIIQMCTEEIADPNSAFLAEALLVRATFHLLYGQGDLADEDFQRLLAMNGVDVKYKSNALIKRGSLRMQQGEHEKALYDFNEAITFDPGNSDIYHHRGQLKLLLDRMDDAVEDFEHCINLNPEFGLAQVQKCFAEYRRASVTKSPMLTQAAMESFERTVAKFNKCPDGYALYAQALVDQQLFEQADKQFEKALYLEPDNANIHVHRGLLHIQWKHDMEAGIAMIRKSLTVDPKCEFAYETLGTFEVQKGNLSLAVELFDSAIRLVKTEQEMAHLFSLKDAAVAQAQVSQNLGITLPTIF